MSHLRRHWLLSLLLSAGLLTLAWGALAPLHTSSRALLFEIPKGTWARRMAGDKVEILSTCAYTTTYSSVAFNGFSPLKAICI